MPKTKARGRWSGVYLVCSLDFESKVSTTQLSQNVFNSRLSKENLTTGVREQLVLCLSCWDIRLPSTRLPPLLCASRTRLSGRLSPLCCFLTFSLLCLSVSLWFSGRESGGESSFFSYLSLSTRSPVSSTLQLIQEADKHR